MRARPVVLGSLVMRVMTAAATVAVACGGPGGSDDPGRTDGVQTGPTALVGETDQGLHIRLDPAGERQVRLRFPADCERDDRPGEEQVTSLHGHPFTVDVTSEGRFTVDEDYVEEGTDGDEEHVEVRIEGTFTADGTAHGTLEVTSRSFNGQSEDFSPDCVSGMVRWTADRPPAEGDNLIVPLATPSAAMAAAGDDLVVGTESGELLIVDGATGQARRLDGSAPAGGAGGAGGTSEPDVPSTVRAGEATAAPAAVAPIWLNAPVAVAGGVWAPDPATGLLTRFSLDGGRPTATISDRQVDSMAAGSDALWTVSSDPFFTAWHLDRRDPITGAVVVSVPAERGMLAIGPTEVWYAEATLAGGRLVRIDPATLARGATYDVDIPSITGELVTTGDRVWWPESDGLASIDLATGQVGMLDLPSAPDALAGDATGVWTVHAQEAVARRIEANAVVRTVDLRDGWWRPAVTDDGALWLAGEGPEGDEPRVIRLDPAA